MPIQNSVVTPRTQKKFEASTDGPVVNIVINKPSPKLEQNQMINDFIVNVFIFLRSQKLFFLSRKKTTPKSGRLLNCYLDLV